MLFWFYFGRSDMLMRSFRRSSMCMVSDACIASPSSLRNSTLPLTALVENAYVASPQAPSVSQRRSSSLSVLCSSGMEPTSIYKWARSSTLWYSPSSSTPNSWHSPSCIAKTSRITGSYTHIYSLCIIRITLTIIPTCLYRRKEYVKRA